LVSFGGRQSKGKMDSVAQAQPIVFVTKTVAIRTLMFFNSSFTIYLHDIFCIFIINQQQIRKKH
jgi:hypothetical protein